VTTSTVTPPESHSDLLDRPLFGHLATVRPDGSPQSSVMWFEWDGALLRFTHTKTRQKFRNLADEPRVAMSIHDPEDPYRALEVRGVVVGIEDDPEGEFYIRLAKRYDLDMVPRDPSVRVVIGVRPESYVAVEGGHVVRTVKAA
jgi:PPOX class probable F420-dependent enzyme